MGPGFRRDAGARFRGRFKCRNACYNQAYIRSKIRLEGCRPGIAAAGCDRGGALGASWLRDRPANDHRVAGRFGLNWRIGRQSWPVRQ